MTPADLISKVSSGPDGEWTSTRWGDGLQILEAFPGDLDFAADAIGVLLERVDALEALCQQMRGYVADLQRQVKAGVTADPPKIWSPLTLATVGEMAKALKGGDA